MQKLYIATISEHDEDGEMYSAIFNAAKEEDLVRQVNGFFIQEALDGHPVKESGTDEDIHFNSLEEIDGFDSYDNYNGSHYHCVTITLDIAEAKSRQHKPMAVGSMHLTSFPDAEVKEVDGRECVVIPVGMNPAISIGKNKDGVAYARLGVSLYKNPESQCRDDFWLKAVISKEKLTKLALTPKEREKYAPIIGGLNEL